MQLPSGPCSMGAVKESAADEGDHDCGKDVGVDPSRDQPSSTALLVGPLGVVAPAIHHSFRATKSSPSGLPRSPDVLEDPPSTEPAPHGSLPR